jgi:hypothetical protein
LMDRKKWYTYLDYMDWSEEINYLELFGLFSYHSWQRQNYCFHAEIPPTMSCFLWVIDGLISVALSLLDIRQIIFPSVKCIRENLKNSWKSFFPQTQIQCLLVPYLLYI